MKICVYLKKNLKRYNVESLHITQVKPVNLFSCFPNSLSSTDSLPVNPIDYTKLKPSCLKTGIICIERICFLPRPSQSCPSKSSSSVPLVPLPRPSTSTIVPHHTQTAPQCCKCPGKYIHINILHKSYMYTKMSFVTIGLSQFLSPVRATFLAILVIRGMSAKNHFGHEWSNSLYVQGTKALCLNLPTDCS